MLQSNKSKKIPLIVVAVYLILVLLATIPVFTGDDPLDAVFLVLLVLPWSFLITPIVDSINPMLFDNIFVGVSVSLIGAAINAVLLYLLTSWLVNKIKGT